MEVPLLDSRNHVWELLDAWIDLYFPTSLIGSNAEDWLTSTTGLDEEELGLPPKLGQPVPLKVFTILSQRTQWTSVCAINSPWEWRWLGLEDQELW